MPNKSVLPTDSTPTTAGIHGKLILEIGDVTKQDTQPFWEEGSPES